MPPTSTLPPRFAHAIEALQAGDIRGWMEICSEDAVYEFPFAPAGAQKSLEGRDVIAAYMPLTAVNHVRFTRWLTR